jgi:hypothetical protein
LDASQFAAPARASKATAGDWSGGWVNTADAKPGALCRPKHGRWQPQQAVNHYYSPSLTILERLGFR